MTTPGGTPACSSTRTKFAAERGVNSDGLNTTVLPMIAGAVVRLRAIAVKLNGATASTKPSSGR